MALHFTHGYTTYGAADAQLDFFARLEDFLVNTVGWTVSSGSGTKDIVFRSIGESGTLTMLFVHIRAVGVGGSIFADVRDDAIGTHVTTQANAPVVRTDQRAEYWITADLDAVLFIVPYLAGEYLKYVGCLMPIALNPPDETYYMVSSSTNLATGTILRHHTGVWDVNITNYSRAEANNMVRSPISREYAPFDMYADRFDACAGQYKFISAGLGAYTMCPRDKVTSGVGAADGEWELFDCAGTARRFIQTAGAGPGDVADGASFAYQTGVEANAANFITNTLPVFMAAIGWNDMGPAGEWATDRLFHSTGEDGTRDIYIVFGYEIVGNPFWWLRVYDDAVGTHKSQFTSTQFRAGNWPATYHMSADLDCLCLVWIDTVDAKEAPQWLGMCEPYFPGLADSDYMTGVYAEGGESLLRNQNGTWGTGAGVGRGEAVFDASSPSLYDGTTYPLSPYLMYSGGAGGSFYGAGWMKYIMHVDGAPLALNDTVTIGAQVYQVFNHPGVINFWALRIA